MASKLMIDSVKYWFKEYGIDEVKVLEFNHELAGTSAEDFVNYLIDKIKLPSR